MRTATPAAWLAALTIAAAAATVTASDGQALGPTTIQFNANPSVITVDHGAEAVAKARLAEQGHGLEFRSLNVRFAAGGAIGVKVYRYVRAGPATDAIDLGVAARKVAGVGVGYADNAARAGSRKESGGANPLRSALFRSANGCCETQHRCEFQVAGARCVAIAGRIAVRSVTVPVVRVRAISGLDYGDREPRGVAARMSVRGGATLEME